ncbi:MAG: MBL fold metallo-hydrolase [Thermanaerothrix sp.]|uniref:MBL fold metallo-hydrolase n=1 Tax=Thermanaerothrix sp. TaxID=2972675 RepID=UPI003C7EBFE9
MMQELFPNLYIEQGYPGVVLGVIALSHGLVLIDAPFRPEDIRSWRSALVNLGGGVERLLVNLDAHMDRTLGSRAMECTVIAHEGVVSVLRNRPSTLKAQGVETGAEWELYENLGSVRWSPPEITFTEHLKIFWNEAPIILEYHPGPSNGAIWVNVLEHKVVFVGDAVVFPQPPFLAQANIPEWLRTLEILASPEYRDYLIVSGRTGLVTQKEVEKQAQVLREIQSRLEHLGVGTVSEAVVAELARELIEKFEPIAERASQYENRLKYGLWRYYLRHYRSSEDTEED